MSNHIFEIDEPLDTKTRPLSEHKKEHHPKDVILYIRFIYITGILVWILILHFLRLYKTDFFTILILAIPFICFSIGYINAPQLTGELEDELFRSNYLSVGLLLVVPLLTWINREYVGDKTRYTKILILAIIMSLLSMIDIWVSDKYLAVLKHGQSVLQTFSIILIVYGLYSYYTEAPHAILV